MMVVRTVIVGTHVVGSLRGCPAGLLEKVDVVREILRRTVKEAGLHPVGESFHQFEPFGVTGVIILSESHLSVHTWPEKNLVAVDVFTCGKEGNAELGFDILSKHFNAVDIDKRKLQR
ncbi:adenosylmethionine decarboxylase [Candidatus Woesearchaeota archaeon]|nr:adenosylmethionine decarboxylase [Candidatus Woesearchaeota archaeon]